MKHKVAATSVIFVLVAIATIPGVACSLQSSVTSYNNSITMEPSEDFSIGLFKDNEATNPWENPGLAFSSAMIGVQKNSGNYYTQTGLEEMSSSNGVYMTTTGSGYYTFTMIIGYSGNAPQSALDRVHITLQNMDPSKTNDRFDRTSTWNEANAGISFDNVTRGDVYKITLEVKYDSAKVITSPDSIHYVNIKIVANSDGRSTFLDYDNNKIQFTSSPQDYNGVKIENDESHKFVESTESGKEGWVMVNYGDSSLFGPSDNKSTSKTTLKFDGDHAFRLYFEVKGNNQSYFEITITNAQGTTIVDLTGNNAIKSSCYVGTGGKNSTTPFNQQVTVSVNGYQQSVGNGITLYIVFEEHNTTT